MSRPVVCDTSVLVPLVVPDTLSSAVRAALSGVWDVVAPDLAYLEAGNAIRRHAVEGPLTREEAMEAMGTLEALVRRWEPTRPLIPRGFELALDLGHPIYDCVFLALAERDGLTLITADEPFAKRVRRSMTSVELVLVEQ